MSKKDNQHIVPRTYLKQWRIADDQNFVYAIDLSNKYKKRVQRFGLNDKIFTRKRYYNDPSFENAYIIEDVLGQDIEPLYEVIMKEMQLERIFLFPLGRISYNGYMFQKCAAHIFETIQNVLYPGY